MKTAALCPGCGTTLFLYDASVAEPVVAQLQTALIFAPPAARQVLAGKSAAELMSLALGALHACHVECEKRLAMEGNAQ